MLEYRKVRGDVIETYKYLHGLYSVDPSDILPLHKSEGMITRGHQLKIQKRECCGQLRANFFGYRIVKLWSPEEIVNAPTVNCLKGRFDRWMGDVCYSAFSKDSEISRTIFGF
jgi:hypothetical protein